MKKHFELIRETSNVVFLNNNEVERMVVASQDDISSLLKVYIGGINHFTSPIIDKILKSNSNIFRIISNSNYILPAVLDANSGKILLNLGFFETDKITRVSYANLYAMLCYGYMLFCIHRLKIKFPEEYSELISTFLLAIFVRIFGKRYGLLTSFVSYISVLKFLISIYTLVSLFEKSQDISVYKKASSFSGFSYNNVLDKLEQFNFKSILDFIQSLDSFSVMPGVTDYLFASSILNRVGLSFLAGLEDMGRFLAMFLVSDLRGTSIVPTKLRIYHQYSYDKIIKIISNILKRAKI